MLRVIFFILKSITDFAKMLFTIQVDDNLSLGLLMCIVFIFLPIVLRVIKFIRQDAMEELDDMYDENKTRNIITSSYTEHSNLGHGKHYTYRNVVQKRRRMR